MLPYLVVSGLTTGSLYALVAMGLVVVYKATTVVNFAHGELFMVVGSWPTPFTSCSSSATSAPWSSRWRPRFSSGS